MTRTESIKHFANRTVNTRRPNQMMGAFNILFAICLYLATGNSSTLTLVFIGLALLSGIIPAKEVKVWHLLASTIFYVTVLIVVGYRIL